MDHHHHLNRHLAHLHQQQQQQLHQVHQLPAHHAHQQHLQSQHELAQLQHLQQQMQNQHGHQHHVQAQPQPQQHHQQQVQHHAHLQQQEQQQQHQQQHHPQQQHVQQRQVQQPRIQIPEGMVGIYVKTMKEKKMIPIEPDATIKVFRRKIAGHWMTEKETLCLIYGGKILEDAKTLADYELKHGATVRLVIKQVYKNQAEGAANILTSPRGYMHAMPQKSDITATPFGLGTMGGLAGTASIGMGSVNFMEMQQRMQHELLSNPESLRIIMENPLVTSLMNRPEEMHELMMANPAMKELIEANPEITQMMHNKELMSTVANLAHNPAMLQELVRHEDRIALSSSEAIGPSLGVRLPEEDDDIIFMGAAEEVGSGGGGGLRGFPGLGQFMRSPWGHQGRRRPPPVSHVFNTAPMRSLLLQMTESPQIMQNMFSAPYIQAMMTSLTQNPEIAEFVASQNPAFKDDKKLMDKIPDLIPHLTAQMQNSAVQGLMTNTRALNALMQVQRGFAALQAEAPDLVDQMGLPHDPKKEKAKIEEEEEKPEEATEEGSEGGSPKKEEKKKRDPKEEMPLFLNQVTNLIAAAVPGSNTSALPPSEKYAAQAKRLEFLGFTNSEAVFEALDFAGGDINAAIQRLVPKTRPAFDL